jgi:hypothetical protein
MVNFIVRVGFAVQKSNKQLKNLGDCPTFASWREAQPFSGELYLLALFLRDSF